MADTPSFAKLVPGFEFLQNLVKNAGTAMPAMGQWIAPTLDPEELDKRISELRTVQYWLEQNARLIAGTVQALEVQRMTLSTLKTMNVQMGDLRESLQARATAAASAVSPDPAPPPAAATAATPAASAPAPASPPAPPAPERASAGPSDPAATPAAPLVDPMQWWGALTKQFTQLAATALHEPAGTPAGQPATPAPARSAARSTKPAAKAAPKGAAKAASPSTARPSAPARKRTPAKR